MAHSPLGGTVSATNQALVKDRPCRGHIGESSNAVTLDGS